MVDFDHNFEAFLPKPFFGAFKKIVLELSLSLSSLHIDLVFEIGKHIFDVNLPH